MFSSPMQPLREKREPLSFYVDFYLNRVFQQLKKIQTQEELGLKNSVEIFEPVRRPFLKQMKRQTVFLRRM